MTVEEQINAGACDTASFIGTETSKGCIRVITKAKSQWFIKPGEEFRAGEDFEAEKTRLILEDKLVIIGGIKTIEETGNDNSVETDEDGEETTTNEGLYKFLTMFKKGLYFNRALHETLKGYRKWNSIFVTAEGLWGTKTTTGGFTGFTTGQIQPSKLILGTDTTTQKEGLSVQLLNNDEVHIDYAFISDKTARKQKGVTQIALSYVNTPANTDTTLTVKATLGQDQNEVFTGITFAKFSHTIDGADSAPTVGDDTAINGTYPLTIPALATGQVSVVRLGESGKNVIVGPDGDYYRSNPLSTTVQ